MQCSLKIRSGRPAHADLKHAVHLPLLYLFICATICLCNWQIACGSLRHVLSTVTVHAANTKKNRSCFALCFIAHILLQLVCYSFTLLLHVDSPCTVCMEMYVLPVCGEFLITCSRCIHFHAFHDTSALASYEYVLQCVTQRSHFL